MVPLPGRIRHAAARRSHRARNAIALAVGGVLALTGAGVAAAYVHLDSNVKVADALTLAGPAPTPTPAATPTPTPTPVDPQAGKPVNLLLIGSDERYGANGAIGGDKSLGSMRSDTTIVVHVSADRSRAELVSIPRDSMVHIPSCTMTNGRTTRARFDMFNSAFATGWDTGGDITSAAACTIKTVQSLTGLTIDHFVVVDFVGFQAMVDAIGGVPICIPENYDSKNAKLHVTAGYQTLDGPTALAYARAREGTNMNGSDLQRAARQQQLVAAMIHQVLSRNVLTSVPALMGFLNAATSSLTVDPGLGHLTDMAGMALSLRGLDPSHITFMTIPVADWPPNHNRVEWTSAATKIWANMVADQPIVSSEEPASTSPSGSATGSSTGSPSGSPSGSATAPAKIPTPTPPANYHPGDPFNAAATPAVCG